MLKNLIKKEKVMYSHMILQSYIQEQLSGIWHLFFPSFLAVLEIWINYSVMVLLLLFFFQLKKKNSVWQ